SCARQNELEYRAPWLVRFCPQSAAMRVDNGAADRQPHPRPPGFRSVERLEDTFQNIRGDARPRIAHGHVNAFILMLGAHQKLPWPRFDRAHGFNSIEDQV